VQIGKENLSRPHHVDFGWLRLLDFHDHVGSRKDDPRVWRNFGARSAIIVIAEAYFAPGLALDDHLMPVMAELLGRRGPRDFRGSLPPWGHQRAYVTSNATPGTIAFYVAVTAMRAA
jgi:hypothetical protein